jgi:tRNA threonylcarbamoyladenosine biosynthesis protein TsaE
MLTNSEKGFIYDLNQLTEASAWIINQAKGYHLWCFSGEMGAGKTTLIKEICKQMGVSELTGSPSFSLVNEYQTIHNNSIYHFDFYRIKTEEEVYDIGYESYFDSGRICLIEWPQKIEQILKKEQYILFEIIPNEESRELRVVLRY